MPGPPLSKTFTYNGTPGPLYRSNKFTTLDRDMILAQRFWNSKDTGTHTRQHTRKNIPQNSDLGLGVSAGGIASESYGNIIE
tara:strand:- start:3462 stop:3707 length:246 start_codon:yes stop_codon:yes gene_type:complete